MCFFLFFLFWLEQREPERKQKRRRRREEEEGGGSFVWPKGGDWEQAFRRLSQLDVQRSACVCDRSGEAQRRGYNTDRTGCDCKTTKGEPIPLSEVCTRDFFWEDLV